MEDLGSGSGGGARVVKGVLDLLKELISGGGGDVSGDGLELVDQVPNTQKNEEE